MWGPKGPLSGVPAVPHSPKIESGYGPDHYQSAGEIPYSGLLIHVVTREEICQAKK